MKVSHSGWKDERCEYNVPIYCKTLNQKVIDTLLKLQPEKSHYFLVLGERAKLLMQQVEIPNLAVIHLPSDNSQGVFLASADKVIFTGVELLPESAQ